MTNVICSRNISCNIHCFGLPVCAGTWFHERLYILCQQKVYLVYFNFTLIRSDSSVIVIKRKIVAVSSKNFKLQDLHKNLGDVIALKSYCAIKLGMTRILNRSIIEKDMMYYTIFRI